LPQNLKRVSQKILVGWEKRPICFVLTHYLVATYCSHPKPRSIFCFVLTKVKPKNISATSKAHHLHDSDNSDVNSFLQESQLYSNFVKQHLFWAQNKMKLQADKNISAREFVVGDKVLLKLQPYTQSLVPTRVYPKLVLSFMVLMQC
jgi:hypothetical protein